MKVYLVRHAIAHERDRKRWPDDSLRPLTPAGKRRFRRAARGLAMLLPRSAPILTSPYVRARATAELLSDALRRRAPLDCPELASPRPARDGLALLRKRREAAVILVGHEPYLGNLLSLAVAGTTRRLDVELRKGGAACVEFGGRIAPGAATLVWMLPPKALRALR
jgi:phosphohistidine phosphatase